MIYVKIIAALAAVLVLALAYGLSSWLNKEYRNTERVFRVSKKDAIEGLKEKYIAMIAVIVLLFCAIGFLLSWVTAALFVCGALFSVVAVFVGTRAAVNGSAITVNAAASGGMNKALKTAFRSGAVMGLCASGAVILGIGVTVAIIGEVPVFTAVTGLGLGASTTALFHCGADATGRGYDLLDSYAGAIVSAIVLSYAVTEVVPGFGDGFTLDTTVGVDFALIITAAGAIGSMAGIIIVRGGENANPASSINTGLYVSGAIVILAALIASKNFFGTFNCAFAVIGGLIVGAAASKAFAARASEGFRPVWSMIFLVLGTAIAEAAAGIYGVALSAVGLLSASAMATASFTYGAISCDAGGSAEAVPLEENAGLTVGRLLTAGERAAEEGKGFTVIASGFTALALFLAFSQVSGLMAIDVLHPLVIIGALAGAALPFLYSAIIMNLSKRAAIIGPALIAVIFPLAIGFALGGEALGGMILGSVVSGTPLAAMLTGNKEPAKETAGLSIRILIKYAAMIAVVFAGLFLRAGDIN